MLHAEFLAGGCDAELEVGVRNLGGTTGLAPMEGFGGFGISLKTRAASGGATLLHAVPHKGWAKKEEVVSQAHDDHHFGRERPDNEIQGRKRQAEKRDPFHFHRQDQKQEDFEIRSNRCDGEKEGEVQEKIPAADAENQGRGDAQEHAEEVVGIQPKCSPARLQHVPDPPGEKQVENDPKNPGCFRNENPCHEPPDLAAEHGRTIQLQCARIAGLDRHEQEDQRIQGDDIAYEVWNGEAAEGFFKAVE